MFVFNVFFLMLIGLSKLTNLKVLDLSNNMIVHHQSISAVGDMAFLKYLNLERNPIAYVENHREITCRYLHENAAVELVRNCTIQLYIKFIMLCFIYDYFCYSLNLTISYFQNQKRNLLGSLLDL